MKVNVYQLYMLNTQNKSTKILIFVLFKLNKKFFRSKYVLLFSHGNR